MLRRFPWAVPDRERDNSFKAFIDAEGENPTHTHEAARAKAAGVPPRNTTKTQAKRKRKEPGQESRRESNETKDGQPSTTPEIPNGKESLLAVPRTGSPSGGTFLSSFGCDRLVVVTSITQKLERWHQHRPMLWMIPSPS